MPPREGSAGCTAGTHSQSSPVLRRPGATATRGRAAGCLSPREWRPLADAFFACEFCPIAQLKGRRYRTRPVADVVAELSAIGERTVFLGDDALALNRRHARELFAAMEGLGKRWVGQGTASLAEDSALLAAMRREGCVGTLVGFESAHEASLKALPKMSGLAIGCAEVVRRFHEAGISVVGSFVFGLDDETPDVFERKYFTAACWNRALAGPQLADGRLSGPSICGGSMSASPGRTCLPCR